MNDEREFLHDVAGALGIAFFLTDAVIDSMSARPDANPEELGHLKKSYEALQKVKVLLHNRRELIIKREQK
jgi:hypothetical protein